MHGSIERGRQQPALMAQVSVKTKERSVGSSETKQPNDLSPSCPDEASVGQI